jgi:superfamily I DNA/RNA helicase
MVDEYQDTNRPQYLLIQRLAAAHRNLCVVGDPDQSIYKWRGADLRNILDFENDFPEARIVKLERNYRSTQVILDAATAVISQNRNRKDKRLYTDVAGGARIRYYRAGDDLDEAEFVARTARTALHDDHQSSVAILYRTNSQSRTIEDALRRSGTAYKIIGGVRFYERKEVKDALAYLKLILSPQDDVSMRRVINVPARGIGKGVMESLEAVKVPLDGDTDTPLLAGLRPTPVAGTSLWAKLLHAVERRLLAPRAVASLTAFRDLITGLTAMAAQESVSIALGKVLDQSGYLQDLREERSEEAEGRIENLMELVSAAREYETRQLEPTLGGFVDQLSLLSDVTKSGLSERARADDDDAQREGPGVPSGRHHRTRGRALSSLPRQRRRSRSRGGAAPVLRRHHARTAAPGAHVGRSPACVRRLPVHGPVSLHRRDSRGTARRDPVDIRQPAAIVLEFPNGLIRARWAEPGRASAGRAALVRLRERKSVAARRPQARLRVRHAQFGLGTIVAVEPLS